MWAAGATLTQIAEMAYLAAQVDQQLDDQRIRALSVDAARLDVVVAAEAWYDGHEGNFPTECLGLRNAVERLHSRQAAPRTEDSDAALLSDVGGAAVRAIRTLAETPDLAASVFTVMDRTAGLATVRVTLRKLTGDENA